MTQRDDNKRRDSRPPPIDSFASISLRAFPPYQQNFTRGIESHKTENENNFN